MNLSGELSDWPVADLLNMLKVTNKTVTLSVMGKRSGVIHFVSGRVSGAAVADEAIVEGEEESRLAAVDAIFVLAGLDQGTFELVAYQGPESDGWDVEDLLADMGRLDELEADISRSGLADGHLMLRDVLSGPVTIAADDWWALASLVSVLSLQQLVEVFGRARAVRMLHTLWRLDLIEAIPAAAEPESPTPESPTPGPEVEDDIAQLVAETLSPATDEAWLDEIASNAEPTQPLQPAPSLSEVADHRPVTGVAAPASTVLTGSVLDEMRRLRSRVGE